MTAPTCGTCRWWDVRYSSYAPYGPLEEGKCRKGIPSNNGGAGQWPTTKKSDWCGEHTPKGGMVSGRDARRAKAKKRATVLVCKRIDGVEPIPVGGGMWRWLTL